MLTDEISVFESGARLLRESIAGLSPDQLRWRPSPDAKIGLWSIHEIVIHMADADAIGVHRMKRVIAEEKPLLIGYDESAFIRSLHYHEQSVEEALTIFELTRKGLLVVLRQLPEAAFARVGIHNEVGAIRLDEFVHKYNVHLDHHLKFIKLKRDAMKR